MLKFTAFLLGVIVCALSFECKAEIVCIHPIPLTIKELAEKEKTGVISHQVAQLNASYLISKYCDKVTEPLKAISSVSLGGECKMEWGHRLGETVYWATCTARKKSKDNPRLSARFTRGIECCRRHMIELCRSGVPNSQSFCGMEKNCPKYVEDSERGLTLHGVPVNGALVYCYH